MNDREPHTDPTAVPPSNPVTSRGAVTAARPGEPEPGAPTPTTVTSGELTDEEATRVRDTPPAAPAGLPAVAGYALGRQIARGGMGVVYAARDTALDREVAVKVMLPEMSAAEFVREARIAGRLPHPGIPPVHALGALPDGRPFLAMKMIRGDTLDTRFRNRVDATADRGELLAAFEQMCLAVGFAHGQGIVHRDLKPSNVMVGAFGEVQVMDWGLAKVVGTADAEDAVAGVGASFSEDVAATVAGTVKGTPAYMAPEQARGEPVDARADVFALGGLLAAILTGKPPFAGDSALDTIVRAASAELADAFARLDACGADAELVGLAKWCLSARAADRPASGEQVAAAVAAYRAGADARLRRAEQDAAAAEAKAAEEQNTRREAEARAREQNKRRRAQLTLAGVLAVTLAGAGIATNLMLEQRSQTQLKAERDARERADAARRNAEEKAEEAKRRQEAEAAAARLAVQAAQADTLIGLLDDLFRSTDPLAVFFGDTIQMLGVSGTSEGLAQLLGPFLRNATHRFRAALTNPAAAPALAKILAGLGNGLKGLGLFADARPALEDALRLRRAHLPAPDAHPDVWKSELDLGRLEAESGDAPAGIARFRRLHALQKAAGADEQTRLTTRFYEGIAMSINGLPDAAAPLHEAAEGWQRLNGRQHPYTLLAKLGLIAAGLEQGDWVGVTKLFGEFREDMRAVPDERVRRIFETILEAQRFLAKAMAAQTPAGALLAGPLPAVADGLRASLGRLEKLIPEDHLILCIFRFELAQLLLETDRGAEADALFARVLADARRTTGLAHPKALLLLRAYSRRLAATKQVGAARALFDEVVRANAARFGPASQGVTLALLERARFELEQNDRPRALAAAAQAADLIRRGTFVAGRSALAGAFEAARQLGQSGSPPHQKVARELFAALHPRVADVYGPASEEMMALLTHEGRCAREAGDRPAADERLARARALLPGLAGPKPSEANNLFYWSGVLELDRGAFAAAEGHLRSALEWAKKMPQQSGEDAEEEALQMAAALVGLGRYAAAATFYDQARRAGAGLKRQERERAWADMRVAVAQLAAGARDQYLKSHARMAEQYGQSTNLDTLARVAWEVGLGQPAGWDHAAFADQFAAAFKPGTDFPWGYRGLALVRLRAGRFEQVEDALSRAGKQPHAADHLIRGLAAAARGDRLAARAHFQRGEAQIEAEKPGATNPFAYAGRNWNQHLEVTLLLAELRAATALPVAPPPRPSPQR
ncbi:serine/threonine-protein kinase [Gemmata sp. JC717]|uniref:serine/threonine-protein kinase n=1 Tax=Gemmata algarum TaxID=2975278 RepID=UPI0021BBAC76|nr:serine/threonine-protein kinase [Gemmata algarum]MDY3552747.1 serine/threonine-protein kinase [Gemmata algarum]